MVTILAIVLGFTLVVAAMRTLDWVNARRLVTSHRVVPVSYDFD
jgi:hypothetical protein